MLPSVTVAVLFERYGERLALRWLAGQAGADRELHPEHSASDFPTSLVGHLNLLRPNGIQVLGKTERDYLDGLEDEARHNVVELLFREAPACIVVADGLPAGTDLVAHAERSRTPLLSSPLPNQKVVAELQHFLGHVLARRISLHGVFMEVFGTGVLLTGRSGVGKSELALELVSRGHRLVADDAPEFSLIAPDTLEGTAAAPALRDFMEVRGLGVVNVRELFGDSALKRRKHLRLVVHLAAMGEEDFKSADRLDGIRRDRSILGMRVPEVTLPVVAGHNLAVLVECTVRNHLLRGRGYDAARDFSERQQRLVLG